MATLTLEELMASLGPKKTSGDEGSIEERPISELIDAAAYFAKQDRPTTPPYGLRIAKIQPPGTQG